MSDLSQLERQIKEKLAAHQELCLSQHNHHAERMHEMDERHRRYDATADHLVRDIIRPRLEILSRQFDNAELAPTDTLNRHTCIATFKKTSRFPANTKLELSVSRDGQWENVCLLYKLSILPVFFQFNGQDQTILPLDRVEDEQVATWVDDKITSFLDAYLRLETLNQYQEANLVTDPVCNMRINRVFAPAQAEYRGQTYHFCLAECRKKFLAAPEQYLGGPLASAETVGSATAD
jgi:YHS domain-containing protein